MALTAGIPGLEHHERPEYLDRVELLRKERGVRWPTRSTRSPGPSASLVQAVGAVGAAGGGPPAACCSCRCSACPSVVAASRAERRQRAAARDAGRAGTACAGTSSSWRPQPRAGQGDAHLRPGRRADRPPPPAVAPASTGPQLRLAVRNAVLTGAGLGALRRRLRRRPSRWSSGDRWPGETSVGDVVLVLGLGAQVEPASCTELAGHRGLAGATPTGRRALRLADRLRRPGRARRWRRASPPPVPDAAAATASRSRACASAIRAPRSTC